MEQHRQPDKPVPLHMPHSLKCLSPKLHFIFGLSFSSRTAQTLTSTPLRAIHSSSRASPPGRGHRTKASIATPDQCNQYKNCQYNTIQLTELHIAKSSLIFSIILHCPIITYFDNFPIDEKHQPHLQLLLLYRK